MKIKLIAFLLLFIGQAQAGWFDDDIETQNSREFILNDNGGFENGKSSWTESGTSVFSLVTSGANLAQGSTTASWDAGAAGEFLTNEIKTLPNKFGGPRVCDVFFIYKDGDVNIDAEIFDGTTVVASRTLTTADEFTEHSFSFVCNPGTGYSFRLASTADAALIHLDAVFVGRTVRTMFATPKILTTAKRSVGTVGSVDNDQGTLLDADFPASTFIIPLSGDAVNTGGSGPADLDDFGSIVTFVDKGFFGNEDIAHCAEGVANSYLSRSDVYFDFSGSSHSAGGWFKFDRTNFGGIKTLMGSGVTADFQWVLQLLTATDEYRFQASTNGTTFATSVSFGDTTKLTPGRWHQFVVTYDGSNFRIYLDTNLIQTVAHASLHNPGGAAHYEICTDASGANILGADVTEHFVNKGTTLTKAQIITAYSKRFSGEQTASGHVLSAESFSFSTLTDRVYFWNLSADALDDSGNAKNLTNVGSTLFTGLNIFGQVGAATLDGSAQYFHRNTDAIFNPGDTSFSTGGFFRSSDWLPDSGNDQALIAQEFSAGVRSWKIFLDDSDPDKIVFTFSSDGSTDTDVFKFDTSDFLPGSWHHVAFTYANGGKVRCYVDGTIVETFDVVGGISASGTNDFSVGAYRVGTATFEGEIEDVFFVSQVLSDNDIKKFVSSRIDHSKNVQPFDQQWEASFFSEDGNTLNDFNKNWIVDKRQNNLYVNLGLSNAGSQFQLVLKNRGLNGDTIFGDDPFDTGFFSVPPSNPVFYNHGLADAPLIFVLQHEGHIDPGFVTNLPAADGTTDFCQWNTSQIKCNLSSLTIDATHRVRIIASSSLAGLALLGDPSFKNGIQTVNQMTKDTIIPVGNSMWFPSINIPSGITLTVNGTLYVAGEITGDGNIVGTGNIISLDKGETEVFTNLVVTGTFTGGKPGFLPVEIGEGLRETAMGIKEYESGVAYLNGTPTITSTAVTGGTFSIADSQLIPRQLSNGKWRLRVTFIGSYTTIQTAGNTVTVSGITFKSDPGTSQRYNVSLGIYNTGGGVVGYPKVFYARPTTGDIDIDRADAASYNRIQMSFDLPLDGKPSWAD